MSVLYRVVESEGLGSAFVVYREAWHRVVPWRRFKSQGGKLLIVEAIV